MIHDSPCLHPPSVIHSDRRDAYSCRLSVLGERHPRRGRGRKICLPLAISNSCLASTSVSVVLSGLSISVSASMCSTDCAVRIIHRIEYLLRERSNSRTGVLRLHAHECGRRNIKYSKTSGPRARFSHQLVVNSHY